MRSAAVRGLLRPATLFASRRAPATRRGPLFGRAMASASSAADGGGEEIELHLPPGVIAGKAWGPEDGEPWIALHGWLDNCGTFDPLMPLFPAGQRVVCLDLAGHGRSYHNPAGHPYHLSEGLHVVRWVADHFDWDKFSLLGHSMGAGIVLMFAATQPERVDRIIQLDAAGPVPRLTEEVIKRTAGHLDAFLSLEKKLANDPTPAYPYEEAKQRLLAGSTQLHGTEVITAESADVLLRRGSKPSTAHPDKVEYTRDLRLMTPSLYGYDVESLLEFAKAIRCKHLMVTANCTSYPDMRAKGRVIFDIFQAYNHDNFVLEQVEGTHHVHLNNPERVAPAIARFIEKFSENKDNL